MATLVFDGECSLCTRLAHGIHRGSNHRVRLLALRSEEAQRLLRALYPDGHPSSFFLITQDGEVVKARHGVGAAFSIAGSVGLRNSFGLSGLYLRYRGFMGLSKRAGCCGERSSVDLQRRHSLGLILKGLGVLTFSLFGLGSLISRTAYGSANEGKRVEDPERSHDLEEAISSRDYRNIVGSLIDRGLDPDLGAGAVFHRKIDPENVHPLERGVVIPFRDPDFYAGYALYRRMGPETVGLALLRVEHEGAPKLKPLAMSVNGESRTPPPDPSCFQPDSLRVCCPSGLSCCNTVDIPCGHPSEPPCPCYPWFYKCCTHYLCYAISNGSPAGYMCTDPCSGTDPCECGRACGA